MIIHILSINFLTFLKTFCNVRLQQLAHLFCTFDFLSFVNHQKYLIYSLKGKLSSPPKRGRNPPTSPQPTYLTEPHFVRLLSPLKRVCWSSLSTRLGMTPSRRTPPSGEETSVASGGARGKGIAVYWVKSG